MFQDKQRILLKISCSHLQMNNKEIIVEVLKIQKTSQSLQKVQLGRTEIVRNDSLNIWCNFKQQITCFYQQSQEGQLSYLIFIFKQIDQGQFRVFGVSEIVLQNLIEAEDYLIYTDIIDQDDQVIGKILVNASIISNRTQLTINFSGRNLRRQKFCCFQNKVTNPELRFVRQSRTIFQKSCRDTRNLEMAEWSPIKIMSDDLYTHEDDEFEIQILENSSRVSSVITNGKLKTNQSLVLSAQNGTQNCGELLINFYNSVQYYSYREYKQKGLKFQIMIGIDFSESNQHYTEVNSLHNFNNKFQKSQYEQAFEGILKVLMDENCCQDDIFLYGFGCSIQSKKSQFTEHCYPLNGDYLNPSVKPDVLSKTYQEFMQKINFSSPTLLTPLLNEAKLITENYRDCQYLVLLIFTDGQILDFDQAFGKVMECCSKPISIVIVGLGDEDFSNMEKLNNNDLAQTDLDGRKASRDIVQFFKFNDFSQDQTLLSDAVFKEIPDQVEAYMNEKGQRIEQIPQTNIESRYTPSRNQNRRSHIDFNLEEDPILSEQIHTEQIHTEQIHTELEGGQLLNHPNRTQQTRTRFSQVLPQNN